MTHLVGNGIVPGTALYFGIYEFTKRNLTANNIPEIVSHLAAGSLGDLAASIVYVPSEVLKTRMQLQGKYNNPHFVSGYNYKGTWHAARTVSARVGRERERKILMVVVRCRLSNTMDLVPCFMDSERLFCVMCLTLHCNLLFMVILKTKWTCIPNTETHGGIL